MYQTMAVVKYAPRPFDFLSTSNSQSFSSVLPSLPFQTLLCFPSPLAYVFFVVFFPPCSAFIELFLLLLFCRCCCLCFLLFVVAAVFLFGFVVVVVVVFPLLLCKFLRFRLEKVIISQFIQLHFPPRFSPCFLT